MIKLHKKQENLILEIEYPELRNAINTVATDPDFNSIEVFSWWNEDNTGNTQINCNKLAQGSLEEIISIVKTNPDEYNYTEKEIISLDNLVTLMIEFEQNNPEYPFIEYGC